MYNNNKIRIFLVDDDSVYLKSLEIDFMKQEDLEIETYATGELCMASISHAPDMVVLDYHLDGISKNAMNGIETLDKIKASSPETPVIMLSSQDKIEVAVNCMHHGATDYLVKSETAALRIQKITYTLLQHRKTTKALEWYMERM